MKLLVTETLFGTVDKVQIAIDRIRQFEPPEGYYVAFSGGKDSQTVYHLCKEAGVKFDAHYNLTTVDPPELVYFIREYYPDVQWNRPEKTMWELIVDKKMPPTRIARYCCDVLKEGSGNGRFVITGVRWAESIKRKSNRAIFEISASKNGKRKLMNDNDEVRRMLETCLKNGQRYLNPIVDWSDEDVWSYLKINHIKYCRLYDEGFKRLGCIGCPMAGTNGQLTEFERWPKYYNAYLRAFGRMLQVNFETKGKEATRWKTAQDVMDWWIYEMPNDPNQGKLFEDEEAG